MDECEYFSYIIEIPAERRTWLKSLSCMLKKSAVGRYFIVETSNDNQKSNLQTALNDESKNIADDEIPFEYTDDDIFGYTKWTADGYTIDKRSSSSVKDLIHSEGDYFDGYKVYS